MRHRLLLAFVQDVRTRVGFEGPNAVPPGPFDQYVIQYILDPSAFACKPLPVYMQQVNDTILAVLAHCVCACGLVSAKFALYVIVVTDDTAAVQSFCPLGQLSLPGRVCQQHGHTCAVTSLINDVRLWFNTTYKFVIEDSWWVAIRSGALIPGLLQA